MLSLQLQNLNAKIAQLQGDSTGATGAINSLVNNPFGSLLFK